MSHLAVGAAPVLRPVTNGIPSTLTVNSHFGVLQGVFNNVGIGVWTAYLAEDVPNLVHILPKIETAEVPVFLAYPEELRHSKRVAAFRDFVTEEIFAYRKRQQV